MRKSKYQKTGSKLKLQIFLMVVAVVGITFSTYAVLSSNFDIRNHASETGINDGSGFSGEQGPGAPFGGNSSGGGQGAINSGGNNTPAGNGIPLDPGGIRSGNSLNERGPAALNNDGGFSNGIGYQNPGVGGPSSPPGGPVCIGPICMFLIPGQGIVICFGPACFIVNNPSSNPGGNNNVPNAAPTPANRDPTPTTPPSSNGSANNGNNSNNNAVNNGSNISNSQIPIPPVNPGQVGQLITVKARACSNSNSEAIKVLFLGQKFSTNQEFLEQVRVMAQSMINTVPYNANANLFEITAVQLQNPLNGCESALDRNTLSTNPSVADNCTSAINQASQSYPHTVAISLINTSAGIAWAQRDQHVINIASKMGPGNLAVDQGLTHEFGHALSYYDDQYLAYQQDNPQIPVGQNCTTDQSCSAWKAKYGSDYISCSQGCFTPSRYRPTQAGSVMLGQIPKYGYNNGQPYYDRVEVDIAKNVIQNYIPKCTVPSANPTPTPTPAGNRPATPTPTHGVQQTSSSTNTVVTPTNNQIQIRSLNPSDLISPTPH